MNKTEAKILITKIARQKAKTALADIDLPELIMGDDLTAARAKIQAIRTKAITYREAIDACTTEAQVDAVLATVHFHDVE